MTVAEMVRARPRMRFRWLARVTAGESTSTYHLLMAPAALLLLIGLIMILSASSVTSYAQYGNSFMFFTRQLVWAAIGVAVMIALSRVDYHRLRAAGWILCALSAAGLLAVLHPAVGERVGGSARWLSLGPLKVQPSEMMKLALLLVAADVVARKQGRLRTLKDVALPLGLIALGVAALVMLQPDLGTTLILALIVFAVLYVGGTSLPLIATMTLGGAGAVLALSYAEGYRRARLFSFLHPFNHRLDSGYQAVQSMIALGSGGTFGVGLGHSRQKWLYVPNAHTDFIFSILGEELGLIGTLGVVALFVMLAWVGVRIAARAPDAFGRLLAVGATAWVVGQALVNMGAVTGLLPITGVPLPLVSFGGSALVFTLAAVGILANVARQEAPRRGRRGTSAEAAVEKGSEATA